MRKLNDVTFCLWGWTKSEFRELMWVNETNFMFCILDAADRTKEGEDQLGPTTCEVFLPTVKFLFYFLLAVILLHSL